MFTYCSFDSAELHLTKNKLDCYSNKDCMEKFCKDFIEHARRICNYEEKEMIPLTDKEIKFYKEQKVC